MWRTRIYGALPPKSPNFFNGREVLKDFCSLRLSMYFVFKSSINSIIILIYINKAINSFNNITKYIEAL